jgi:hypothetical protein
MTSTSKAILWSGAAIAILLLGVVVCGALIFRRVIRNDRAGSERQEQHRASVDAYIDELTEKRTGDPPEFLYHVEYRILKTPYPTAATMQQRLGTADSIKTVGSETQLEWLGNPSSQPVLLRADFAKDGKLSKLHYYYKQETIGRWPSDWEKEIQVTTPIR